ncbi:hypothetical protein Dimus_008676 [Dionaea muscipula]
MFWNVHEKYGEEDKKAMESVGSVTKDEEEDDEYSNSSSLGGGNRWLKKGRKTRNNSQGIKPRTTSRFKGVVQQQNGHWGAQIYANHQRIWLGTFKSEKEAASAYDSAGIKLRTVGDSYRNFPWTEFTVQEPFFQSLYSQEEVLSMIKDGSYKTKYADFVRTTLAQTQLHTGRLRGSDQETGDVDQEVFQKELTPSDVGKLNRLVIPRKHAIKYFPRVEESTEDGAGVGGGGGEEAGLGTALTFQDRSIRSMYWCFRYCYWKSSQSFVFTKGWSRFVKEKKLKSKDTVSFYRRELRGVDDNERRTLWMIDVNHSNQGETESAAAAADLNRFNKVNEEEVEASSKRKYVRLFGVVIS